MPPNNMTVLVGGNYTFRCKSRAYPQQSISWSYKRLVGNTTMSVLNDTGRGTFYLNTDINDQNFGELMVADVNFQDQGIYQCNVSNEVASDLASAELIVHGKLISITIKSSKLAYV